MIKILVPTDFSANADTALYYAIEIAKRVQARLVLLHAITVDETTTAKEEEVMRRHADFYLKSSVEKIRHAGAIDHEFHVMEGSAGHCIIKAVDIYDISLIVMGTKGQSNLSSVLFGSNTANVVFKADCPVIAVPEGVSLKPIKKFTYATEYRSSDIDSIRQFVPLAKPYNAQIDVLHIADREQSAEEEIELMRSFMEHVNKEIDYNNFSFQLKTGDVHDVLKDYLEKGACDMLVLSTHQRNWWQRFFGSSVTNEVVYNTTTPVMIFHRTKTGFRLI